jgi:hypothetical protein
MPRLEASRPRLVRLSVGRSVCRSVGLSSKQVLLCSCLQNKVCFQNKFCYEVGFKTRFAFKTSFAMKLASKQGISARNTNKQANKNNNSFCLSTVIPCRIGVPWPLARDSGAEVPGIHDDVVLVQLVLIHSG